MSKRRNPFKKVFQDTKWGRYEVSKRTGTPRYVSFNRPGQKWPVYHVVKSVSVKTDQRPHKLIRGFMARYSGQWRWRAESVGTVCNRSNYLYYRSNLSQLHDRVSSQDRKCIICFG